MTVTDIVAQHWQTLRHELRRSRRNCNKTAVHNARVSIRRMLAVLGLFQKTAGALEIDLIRIRLKKILRKLGPLRDTQVLITHIRRLEKAYPQLVRSRKQLRLDEKRLRKKAGAMLNKMDRHGLEGLFTALQEKSRGETLNITRLSRRSVRKAFRKVQARCKTVTPGKAATIHRVRVAFKRFRYLTEALAPQLKLTPAYRRQLRAFHQSMGAIQDLEVLLHWLRRRDVTRRLPPSLVAPLTLRLRARQRNAARRFMAKLPLVDGFHPLVIAARTKGSP